MLSSQRKRAIDDQGPGINFTWTLYGIGGQRGTPVKGTPTCTMVHFNGDFYYSHERGCQK